MIIRADELNKRIQSLCLSDEIIDLFVNNWKIQANLIDGTITTICGFAKSQSVLLQVKEAVHYYNDMFAKG